MEFREFFEKEKQTESLKGIAVNALNLLVGAARTGAGAMTIGDEALAKLMGQGTKGRMTSGANQFKRGLRQVFIGDSKPTELQPQIAQSQSIKKQPTEIQITQPQPKPIKSRPKTKTKEEQWEELAKKLKEAKTSEEKEKIQTQMGLLDPVRYGQIIRSLSKYRRFNPSKRRRI